MKKTTVGIISVLVVLGIVVFMLASVGSNSETDSEVHEHVDFKVYISGESINFSQEHYMTNENHTLSNFAHLHDMNGNVIHKHAEGVTLRFFFKTLGMTFNQTCFAPDNKSAYCTNDANTLKFYVNGKEHAVFGEYEVSDGNKILISYGNETDEEIRSQINTLTDDACIYSGTCPERGTPPEELSCAGESGCVFEVLE